MNDNPRAWPTFEVDDAMIEKAKTIRGQRAKLGPGGWNGDDIGGRWVGDLCAMVARTWMHTRGARRVVWARESRWSAPDFRIGGTEVRVRGSTRRVFSPDMGMGLAERHRKHSPDTRYLFATYDGRRTVRIVGHMRLGDFITLSDQYAQGEYVHVGMQELPNGEVLYDVAARYFTPPEDWLRSVFPGIPPLVIDHDANEALDAALRTPEPVAPAIVQPTLF